MKPTAACEGRSSYWDKYYYFPTNRQSERMGHNLHHESLLRDEVRALFQLYDVKVMGIVNGQVHVLKWFATSHTGKISAANDGPADAPIEYWQAVCKTLLDYAVEHGYKESHEQKEQSDPV